MLMSGTRYAFLLSADEIIFLKYDLESKCEHTDDGEQIELFVEPHLIYSKPMKLTDVLDEEKGRTFAGTACESRQALISPSSRYHTC